MRDLEQRNKMKSVLLASFLTGTSAATLSSPALPHPWTTSARSSPSDSVRVIVALKQRNLDQLPALIMAVSDPASPKYGEHLTTAQLDALTAPTPEAFAAVEKWVSGDGAHAVTVQRSAAAIEATLSVEAAEEIFGTTFYTVQQGETGQTKTRARGEYTVPIAVEAHVDNVVGLHGLPLPPRYTPRTNVGASAKAVAAEVLPAVIAKQYGIPKSIPSGSKTNRQAVAEFQGQTMNHTDLAKFFTQYVPDATSADAKVYATHGEPKEGDGVEAILDIEYMMGVSPGIKTEFFEQMNNDFGADLLAWTGLLLGADAGVNVHSISYGWQGDLKQIGVKPADVTTIDSNFQKLAAKGVSIIFASGDSGSGYTPPHGPQPAQCPANPGTVGKAYEGTVSHNLTLHVPSAAVGSQLCCQISGEVHGKYWSVQKVSGVADSFSCQVYDAITGQKDAPGVTSGTEPVAPTPAPGPAPVSPLYPSWPASSPWITAVGATRFTGDKTGAFVSEDAVGTEDHFGSGGGFSSMWTVADYQKDAVAKYFETVDASTLPDPKIATYSKGGRATPDVSALGTGYTLIVHGQKQAGIGGTSASTPVFAGMISLINEARAKAGKSPLGFLNPFIYANTEAFMDVTTGSNKVGRGGATLAAGFECTTGWDPATGVGTPNFPKLMKAALAAK